MRLLSTRLAAVLAATTLALHALPGQAHGIWFAQRADRLALVYGDGAEDLDAVKRLPKLTSVEGFGRDGAPVPVKLTPEGRLPFVDLTGGPAVLSATMNNGLWSKTPDGRWHGKGKDELPDAAISGRYMKYATHLVSLPQGHVAPVPGQALQIVPVGTKFPLHKGEPLTVRVLFQGRPLAGAKVWPDMVTDPDAEPLVADREGLVTLPVRNQGLNVVKTENESPSVDPGKTLMTHHLATLSFALEHAPE